VTGAKPTTVKKEYMTFKSLAFTISGLTISVFFVASFSTLSFAQEKLSSSNQIATETVPPAHNFIKKNYTIKGNAKVLETVAGTEIVFSEDFETRSGPDLKVYLSKLSLSDLKDKTVAANSLKIGVLKSKNGAQHYTLPDGVSLSDYKSVVIHCEAFSKLWGGFDL